MPSRTYLSHEFPKDSKFIVHADKDQQLVAFEAANRFEGERRFSRIAVELDRETAIKMVKRTAADLGLKVISENEAG